MRSALPYLNEPQGTQDRDDLSGFEDRNFPHLLRDRDVVHPNKFGFKIRFTILQSMAITSCKFTFSWSSVAPCEWAPGNPGTHPTNSPVSGSRSITAEKLRIAYLLGGSIVAPART